MSEYIITEPKDYIQRIEINRPKQRNAITRDMYAAMAKAINEGEQNPLIRVILLHGQKNYFTAGNDIKDFQNRPKLTESNPVGDFMTAITHTKKPLIAAVSGYAIGIGTTMLLHFDLVYAGDTAKFQLPFINLGLCPEFGSTFLLPRLAGPQHAKELFYFGDFFDAQEAYEIGLVNKIFSEQELLQKVLILATRLTEKPPAAMRLTKRLIKQNLSLNLERIITEEGQNFAERIKSPEAKEAFAAFYERRKPDFSNFD